MVDTSGSQRRVLRSLEAERGSKARPLIYTISMTRMRLLPFFLIFVPFHFGFAQDVEEKLLVKKEQPEQKKKETPAPPQWYEQIGGILALPTALLTPIAAYVLIRKSRVETEKARVETEKSQLELIEKRRSLGLENKPHAVIVETEPMTYRLSVLIARFILFDLMLLFIGLLHDPVDWGLRALGYGIYEGLDLVLPKVGANEVIGGLIYQSHAVVDLLLRASVYVLIGWPLLKDVFAVLSVPVYSPWDLLHNIRKIGAAR